MIKAAPQRIRRERTPGWRMPEGVVYVGRPSKWGNPFVDWQHPSQPERRSVILLNRAHTVIAHLPAAAGDCVYYFEEWIFGRLPQVRGMTTVTDRALYIRRSLHELAGRDLACWCSLERRCHADVLLRLANNTQEG